MKNIREEFEEFLDETQEVATKLGITKNELFALFLQLKYEKRPEISPL